MKYIYGHEIYKIHERYFYLHANEKYIDYSSKHLIFSKLFMNLWII